MTSVNKQSCNHSFLGLSKCPVNIPVHTVGLGLVAYSLYLSFRVYTHVPHKGDKPIKMPIAFDFFGRPAIYAHPCVGAMLYPTLILLQSGAECGYGMAREAAANAKKGPAQCPLNQTERFWVQALFGFSVVTLFAQAVATRVVLDRKTPEEVEVDNLHAAENKPYILATWKMVAPLALAFIPTVAAVVCKAIHKKK
eukprot:GILI01003656.1.p1 GENE.GILI01003656.1~~GILI01003656.1.p1  ORF type:complete len:196 (-),score=54.66 GILI01003656.1:189-776(-)